MSKVIATGVTTVARMFVPHNAVAAAPTPIAPAVCATVLRVNIADKGLSISFLYSSSNLPVGVPDCTC